MTITRDHNVKLSILLMSRKPDGVLGARVTQSPGDIAAKQDMQI